MVEWDMEVPIPKNLVWDYTEPPADPMWRLQRIADAFPAYGRDRGTVHLLYEHRDDLRLRPETRSLIELYEEVTVRPPIILDGLTPGTTYTFQARWLGKPGYSDWGDAATFICT